MFVPAHCTLCQMSRILLWRPASRWAGGLPNVRLSLGEGNYPSRVLLKTEKTYQFECPSRWAFAFFSPFHAGKELILGPVNPEENCFAKFENIFRQFVVIMIPVMVEYQKAWTSMCDRRGNEVECSGSKCMHTLGQIFALC